jgi:hypothetical protein
LAGLDSLLTHVDSPVVVVDLDLLGNLGSLGLHLLELVIAADVLVAIVVGAILRGFITALAAGAVGSVAVLSSLLGSSALGLVLLALLGLVLEDEAAELQAKVDVSALTTGLAVKQDTVILDDNIGLRVLALLAENELVDEAIEVVLKLGSVMGSVDDPTVVLGIDVGLSTKLEAKELDYIGTGAGKRSGNAAKVDDNGLDTVSLAFNLGLQTLHLVAIEGVADIAADVDESHGDGVECLSEE